MGKQYLRLKEAMADRGISGKELADRVGVSTTSVSAMVTGKTQPRFELLEEIAGVLGVEVGDLFISNGKEPLYIKKEGKLVEVGNLHKTFLK